MHFRFFFLGGGGVSNNLPLNKESLPSYKQSAAGTSPRRQRGTESAPRGAGGGGGGLKVHPENIPQGAGTLGRKNKLG